MRIDGPQITGSFNLNGDTVADLDIFTTTSSFNMMTASMATTGSNVFVGTQTSSGSIVPSVNNTYDLGSPTHQFRHVYISSGSLYVNGTKVLGSTAQELQITTDAGQSFKILESSSDTITLQSADGNITLATSGGGDVIMDPTNGVIGLKGTVTIYTGNKITSSDGNSIQFGNGIAVTGSIVSTTTSLVSGSSQITYSGLSGVPSDIISGSGQLTTLGIATTGSNTFNGNLTVTGFIDTQELRTTYISSSILYRSGSTKFGDELTDTHSFTGSILISGSISVPGSNLVSGSSQVLNGSGVFSGSAQLPSGIVSGSAQTIANLPSGVVSGSAQVISSLPSGTVSGSVQVDVMSTTNIARLATTGSNVFTGALTGTSATFSTGLAITGTGGVTNSANKFNLDFYGGNSRFYSLGTDTSTKGGYEFHTNSSNGSLDVISLGIASTGAATFYSTGKFNSGITGGSIIFDASTNYGLIQDANSVSRIWFENTGGYRTLFDLPSAGTSFAFRTSAGTIITSITSAGAATFSDALTIRTSSVSSGGSAITAYGYDGAADLHTTRDESPFNVALYLHNNPVTGQGYGTGILFRAKSDTTNSRVQGSIGTTWTTATDGSRTAKMIFSTVNAGVASDKVTILGAGEVGIGVIPTAGNKFWVKGSSTASADTTLYLQNSAGTSLVTVKNSNTTHIGIYTGGGETLNVSTNMSVRANLTGNEQNIFHVGNTGSGVNDGYMRLFRDGVVKVLIAADNSRGGDTHFSGGGNFGINIDNPLATLSTLGGAVQIMGNYRNHATIIKSAGTAGTLSGQLTITIPEMSNASSDGYGGFSCEVYLSAYPGHYCHVWFSGYINGGVTPSEATILRSNGGYSISQSSYGTYNQGFQFIINYPDTFIHPTARIIFNKGGSPNGTAYPANNITAVFS